MSYIPLKCGHFTTADLSKAEQPIHRLGTRQRGHNELWCESCNKWVAVQQPTIVIKKPPKEPLF